MKRVLALLLLASPLAAEAMEPAVGAEVTWTHISIAGESFNPLAARLRLALQLNPEWELSGAFGAGVTDENEVGVTATLESLAMVGLRYSASLDDNARLVLGVGYGQTAIDVDTEAKPGWPGSETYSGVVWSLSLQERLARHPNWIGTLDIERWYDKDDLTISMISYGFRYEF
jgi:hypothetical protein